MISNPSIWAVAVQEIDSLQPKNYVAGSIINLFLLTEWYRILNDTYCHFVDLFMTASFIHPEPEEIAQFRSYSGLFSAGNAKTPPPLKPVVFIICRHQHYFTVFFDYKSNHVWVFGRNPNPTSAGLHINVRWDDWNGLMYWRRVAALFGWPVSDVDPMVNVYDLKQVFILFDLILLASLIWSQNGLDCGPIAVSITLYVLHNGPDVYLESIPGNQSPYVECPHLTRKVLL